jgi:hypothetical protein
LANQKHVLGTHNMFFHAHIKTITFVKISILVILRFQRPPDLPKAHVLGLLDMFLHASMKTITFVKTCILVILRYQPT